MDITWSDKMGHRDRRAWALLVSDDGVVQFNKTTIPGIVAVVGSDYHKNGKWSHTTYRLRLAKGVRFVSGRNGWETGRFVEGLAAAEGRLGGGPVDQWVDVANALGVSISSAKAFLATWRPNAAAKLDETEEALASLDSRSPEGAVEIQVSFGGPTRKARERGFWGWPVVVTSKGGEEVGRVLTDRDWTTGIEATVTDERLVVLGYVAIPGPGGGYVTLRLGVPEGARAFHCPPD